MGLLESQSAAALSLRAIARAAGVSHNAPYHHFGDRTGLLKRLAEMSQQELLDGQRRAVDKEAGGAVERLLACGEAYVHYAVRHPNRFSAIFNPEICEPGSPTPGMAPLIAANENLLSSLVEEVWPGAAPTRAAAMWSAIHGLATLVVAGHLPEDAVPGILADLLPETSHSGNQNTASR